jgi:hypothetical protein
MCSSTQTAFKREIVAAASPGASGPRRARRASEKSPVLIPLRYRQGISSSRLLVLHR